MNLILPYYDNHNNTDNNYDNSISSQDTDNNYSVSRTLYTEPPKNIILNETAIVVRAKENSDVDMDYIYIMLQTAPIQNALLKLINDKGKATPKLSKEMLNMIHIIKLTEEERTKIIEEHIVANLNISVFNSYIKIISCKKTISN